jgi:hypothetical protein
MLPPSACAYIATSLDNTPATLAALLSHLPTGDPVWEIRPDTDRFSLREIVAHLADWETVWKERFERTLGEETPLLLRPDPNQRSEEQGYAHADPQECLARFAAGRASLTAWLRALPEDAWKRMATLDRMGDIPLSGLTALALAHDSYHMRQVAEWHTAAG